MGNKIKIYLVKIVAVLATLLSMLVYNLSKPIAGIKVLKNIKYKDKGTRYNKFDIYYKKGNIESEGNVPVIIYFHGGGWVSYSKNICTTLNRRMSDLGYLVFSCNYRLSPKVKMEDIIDDAICAMKKASDMAAQFCGDNKKIIIAGDSAGAHIAAMMMALTSAGDGRLIDFRQRIKALVLFYGVFNLSTALESRFSNIKTYISAAISAELDTAEGIEEMKKYSPACYDLTKFSPCFIASGEVDKLHKSQSFAFGELLKQNGVQTKEVFFDDKEYKAMHAFMAVDGISTSMTVLKELEKFLLENVK